MAEGGSSIDTTRESSVDSEVVKLKVKQKDCELTVAQTELSWTIKDQKKNCTFSVRRRDLVAVKTKEDVKNKDSTVLTVVYVKQQKDFVLKRCEESFSGSNSVCLAVAKTLQDGINQCADRPKRLLVLINPISGFSRGEKNYKNICAPIFEEAGIQTDVIVTARAHHTEDILSTYDLSSIDGITLVGGDGLFHEAANGIVRRMAVETGSDINNLEFSPMEFTIPMALIPCGTGNGVAKQFLRNYDISTAVYAIVIVTSRAHHTEEILAIYDLSSIDGIAVVGGDGLYHEAANGLIRRMAADTGGDVNDPNFWPPEFPVAIAIIPCGTGNGIAREQMGNFDIATAVYAAVLGFRSKKNISRVFSNGKLISYSILLVGYGLWGDIIYTSETRRHWGVMRYPASVMSMMLMLSRTRSLNVEIKAPSEFTLRNSANLARIKELTDTQNKSPQGQETDVDNIGSVTNVADSESTKTYQAGFSTIEGRFTGVVMLAEMMSLSCNPSKPHEQDRVTNVSHVFLSKPGGKLQYLKLLYKMYSRDSEILKLRLMDPHDETSDQGRKERILNIDGDIHLLERTEFHVKLFPERIPMFCNIPVFTGRS
ncbi:uncharacterized protein LOC127862233 isoform X2 [Dreissena polymorpha]|uniref:uncharacterized protein LOC127862233 isoform X2 n=1 Tax=Dreissena polymorpha TaxID=45954 RepID=UPI002264A032|nr:uncharacterized protein LOC127862233 isoform X2 [Dreissena polymorpha]